MTFCPQIHYCYSETGRFSFTLEHIGRKIILLGIINVWVFKEH